MMLGHRDIVYIRSDRRSHAALQRAGPLRIVHGMLPGQRRRTARCSSPTLAGTGSQGRDAAAQPRPHGRRPSPARRMASRCRCCSSWNATVSTCRTTSPSSVTTTASTRATWPDHHPSDPCPDGPRSGPHDTRANREAAARRTVQDVPRAADRPFDHRSSA